MKLSSLINKPKRLVLITGLCLSVAGIGSANAQEEETLLNTLPRYSAKKPFKTLTFPQLRKGKHIYQGTVKCGWNIGCEMPELRKVPRATQTTWDKGFNPIIARQLDLLLDEIITQDGKPGVVIRVDMGRQSWRGVAGTSRIEECCGNKPRVFSDKFRIGSITKMVMASVVVALAQEGRLNLDDTMEKWFSDESWYSQMPNGNLITVRDLLRHQSGLADYVPFDNFVCNSLTRIKPESLLIPAFKQGSQFEPGNGWLYSNTNYILVGLLIEKVTKKPVAKALNHHLLIPLKAFNTVFPSEAAIPYYYASGYMNLAGHLDSNGNCIHDQTTSFRDTTFIDPSLPWTAGGVISNVNDLTEIVKGQVMGTYPKLSPAFQKERFQFVYTGTDTPKTGRIYYALGMYDIKGYRGHIGQVPGYGSAAYYHQEQKIAIVINMNSYSGDPGKKTSTDIFLEILDILDGKWDQQARRELSLLPDGRTHHQAILGVKPEHKDRLMLR